MSARPLPSKVRAIDAWGARPVYRARVVHSEPASIVVKWTRRLVVGKRISFATLSDLQALGVKAVPRSAKWRSAVIWRIAKDCLHLTRT